MTAQQEINVTQDGIATVRDSARGDVRHIFDHRRSLSLLTKIIAQQTALAMPKFICIAGEKGSGKKTFRTSSVNTRFVCPSIRERLFASACVRSRNIMTRTIPENSKQ